MTPEQLAARGVRVKALARIAYRAIIGEQATVDHVADDAMGRALTKWDADG